MKTDKKAASVILAAGRGSRMKQFEGNKTLLPLISGKSLYEGSHPILLHILNSLPAGPKAVVVNYQKQEIMEATHGLGITYCEQQTLNGTGGALIAARTFLETQECDELIITMGDVPLVKSSTYQMLLNNLRDKSLAVLAFQPESKKKYGVLEVNKGQVRRIIEWKYWKAYSEEKQRTLRLCNSGIYAARKKDLLEYLLVLASRPHRVHKEINGKMTLVQEYFITDLVEYMYEGGAPVGYVTAEHEEEVMGVDDASALVKAQEIFTTGTI